MSQSPTLLEQTTSMRDNDVSTGHTVFRRPLLTENSLPFFLGDLNEVLPATARAVVTTPVLNRWQLERRKRHSQNNFYRPVKIPAYESEVDIHRSD